MATAGVNRMMLWTDLEGRELMGRWRLGRLVRPEGRTAWFEATEAHGRPLMLSITETLNDDDELVRRLRAAAEVRHPNVVAMREAVATRIDDTHVVLGAMEPTEENLADVLRERALSVTETQTVLEALVQGLAAIHQCGLVHGKMEPASVLAVGETIKLRSDCLQKGNAGFATAAADDVRGIGRIVTQALTRRIPSGGNDPVLQLLPEPMVRAVRRALGGGATVAEIAALASIRIAPVKELSRESLPEAKLESAVVSIPQTEGKALQQSGPVAVRSNFVPADGAIADATEKAAKQSAAPGMTNTVRPDGIEKPAGRLIAMKGDEEMREVAIGQLASEPDVLSSLLEDDEPRVRLRAGAPWVIAAAVVLVLATVLALHGLMHRGSAAQSAQTAMTSAGSAGPEHAVKPSVASRTGVNTEAVTTPGWRVVAYTYNHEAQAEHKAQTIAKRYPQLTPGVFSVEGRPPYLVTLGGVMSKQEALALRKRAIRMGLPRDTYTQNYH